MKVLGSFGLRSLHLILLLLFLCHEVAANTEIINFSSSREPTVDLPLDVVGNWSRLYPTDNERQWALEPAVLHTALHQVCEQTSDAVASHPPFSCPHELWLLLDVDDEKWASYSTFTLRLSWPASAPADFAMALYSQKELRARLFERETISTGKADRAQTHGRAPSSHPPSSSSSTTPHTPTTRSRYAHIRAVHVGVPTPGSRSHPQPRVPVAHPDSDAVEQARGGTVPLIVILEPVYGGVLPATLLPTVGFLVPIVLVAVSLVPWVTAYLDPFVRQAREDMNAGVTRASKQR